MVKNDEDKDEESLFKVSYTVLTDLLRDLLEENNTMSSSYKRTWKSGETKDEHIGDMYTFKRKGSRQLHCGRPLCIDQFKIVLDGYENLWDRSEKSQKIKLQAVLSMCKKNESRDMYRIESTFNVNKSCTYKFFITKNLYKVYKGW